MASPQEHPVPFYRIFNHADIKTILLFILTFFSAALHGALFPVLNTIFGSVLNSFSQLQNSPTSSSGLSEFHSIIVEKSIPFLLVALLHSFSSFLETFLSTMAAERYVRTLRYKLLKSLVRQPVHFYDAASLAPSAMPAELAAIRRALGDRLAVAIQVASMIITATATGFVHGWRLTSVMLAGAPIVLALMAGFDWLTARASFHLSAAEAAASSSATESLSLIHTVDACGAQQSELSRYEAALAVARHAGVRAVQSAAGGAAGAALAVYVSDAVSLWYGATSVLSGRMASGDMIHVYRSLSIALNSLSVVAPAFKAFSEARSAAGRIFSVIERESEIDPLSDGGIIPNADSVTGALSFKGVGFRYSSMSAEGEPRDIFHNLDLEIAAGSSEALVGRSGSGKSTVARLLQRLYDPTEGMILLDGINFRDLNLYWLRSQIGVVAQTPHLFHMTIRENIALGAGVEFSRQKNGNYTSVRQQPSDDDIIACAKLANAHNFIAALPQGYDTVLGERGSSLSGGQRQRICIARALLKDPKILILDECTAGLDVRSEQLVWRAIEDASAGRTTITIAHRLSTVRNATNISFVGNGGIVERGSHERLIRIDGGNYRGLVGEQMGKEATVPKEIDDSSDTSSTSSLKFKSDTEKVPTKFPGKADLQQKHVEEKEPNKVKPSHQRGGRSLSSILSTSAPDWYLLLIGFTGALVLGSCWQVHSIILVRLIAIVLGENDNDSNIRKFIFLLLAVALSCALGTIAQQLSLGVAGQRLSQRLRKRCFDQLLHQNMGFFDRPENAIGALSSLLDVDAGRVQGLLITTVGIGGNLLAFAVLTAVTAFTGCVEFAMRFLPLPLFALCLIIVTNVLATRFESKHRAQSAIKIDAMSSEMIHGHATIRSLAVETDLLTRLDELQRKDGKLITSTVLLSSAYGICELCQSLVLYGALRQAVEILRETSCSFSGILQTAWAWSYFVLLMMRLSIYGQEITSGRVSSTRLFRFLALPVQEGVNAVEGGDEDSDSSYFEKKDYSKSSRAASVSMDKVYFSYPTRPDAPVLQGMNLNIKEGEFIALVGESGHGKSTVLQMLLRQYVPTFGSVRLDRRDLNKMSTRELRARVTYVPQEPQLFNRTVFDNIAYGLPHNGSGIVTHAAVERAACLADAHGFITALQDGYDTVVGVGGDRLSGGQRQRVAVARALLQGGDVLLLDEATSALDAAGERAVNNALSIAAEGRTCVCVAHRMESIRRADRVVVVRHGKVVESGKHKELL